MKLVSVPEMQAIEREADGHGLSYAQMMENAGQSLAREVLARYSALNEKSILGLVGAGNNGGDTLIALGHLAIKGWRVTAYAVRPRPAKDLLVDRLIQAGGQYIQYEEERDLSHLTALVSDHKLLLDGVLGTGTRLPLRPELAELLGHIQYILGQLKEAPHVVAVDCPSGVDCDTGEAAPESIPAELTVTMAAVKQGLLRFPAFALVGEICAASIGPVDALPTWSAVHRSVADADMVRALLPPRPLDSHKGTFGSALIIAGCLNYTGAALLAGEAAYRSGAGWVTLGVTAPVHALLAGHFREATWLPLPHENGFISSDAVAPVMKNLGRATALLFGPGFGMEDTTRDFVARLLGFSFSGWRGGLGGENGAESASYPRISLPPLVVDADGLKLLARLPDWAARLPCPAVLTPHAGEMSTLSTLSRTEIQADRIGVAERFAAQWGHVVVLKGPCTVIAGPDGQTTLIPVATPALARAGTGDVLAGMIVGLRAQGVPAFSAAVAAAWIHAQAGLAAARKMGSSAPVLAGDVLRAVPEVLAKLL